MSDERMKICARCELNLPASMFNRRRDVPGGLQSYCRVCNSVATRRNYVANPAPYIDGGRRRRFADPERHRALKRAEYRRRKTGIPAHEPFYLAEIPK